MARVRIMAGMRVMAWMGSMVVGMRPMGFPYPIEPPGALATAIGRHHAVHGMDGGPAVIAGMDRIAQRHGRRRVALQGHADEDDPEDEQAETRHGTARSKEARL